MPFTKVDDQVGLSPDGDFLARHLSSAVHPSSQVPLARLLNIQTPYSPMEAPEGAKYPRATVRPLPRINGAAQSYAGKIWDAPGVPAKEKGTWVTNSNRDLGLVVDWAWAQVKKRRPKDPLESLKEVPC